ncbi:hypothetical protein ACWCYL_02130 [Streptomyces sp. 900105755]
MTGGVAASGGLGVAAGVRGRQAQGHGLRFGGGRLRQGRPELAGQFVE